MLRRKWARPLIRVGNPIRHKWVKMCTSKLAEYMKLKKKKSTAALIRNAKNRLKGHLFTLFSLYIFDMRIEKAAVFFDKIFNLIFLLSFSVIRWNFGIFSVLFNGGVLLLVEWT